MCSHTQVRKGKCLLCGCEVKRKKGRFTDNGYGIAILEERTKALKYIANLAREQKPDPFVLDILQCAEAALQ